MIQEAMSLMGGKGGGGMPDVSALAGMMGAGGNGSSSSGRGGAREPFKGFADEDAWNNPRWRWIKYRVINEFNLRLNAEWYCERRMKGYFNLKRNPSSSNLLPEASLFLRFCCLLIVLLLWFEISHFYAFIEDATSQFGNTSQRNRLLCLSPHTTIWFEKRNVERGVRYYVTTQSCVRRKLYWPPEIQYVHDGSCMDDAFLNSSK